MKKWHKRTLCVLTLGVLGTVALGLRPAFTPNDVQEIKHFSCEIPLPEHRKNSNFAFTHTIQLHNPHRGTWFSKQLQQSIHPQLTPAEWPIRVYCEDGKLRVSASPPRLHSEWAHLRATWVVGIGDVNYVRRPNGSKHAEYQLHISCHMERTACFWQKTEREMFVQFITIDVADEAADMGTALLAETTGPFFTQFAPSTTGPEPKLPARYCESPLSNALLRLLHTIAACTPETHEQLTPRLVNGAARLANFATTAPWPDCWGESADMARTIAYRIGPTLEYIAENDCFGNQQLADFINSDNFSRIFGEKFTDSKSSDINADLENIDIQRINIKE
ncbi:MAG: hypothetical protein IKZ07_04605 [Akkermansia sp.]|nr:hypothetical protein [Akkermansia sp.]